MEKITVNFENVGKKVINSNNIILEKFEKHEWKEFKRFSRKTNR